MKLELSHPSWNKNAPKIVEWAVFLAFCAAAAWCFWFYYDTTQTIEKTAVDTSSVETNVKENLWKKVSTAEEERAKNFLTAPVIVRDPFQ